MTAYLERSLPNMIQVICPREQRDLPMMAILTTAADVQFRPLADMARDAWDLPLILLGVALGEPDIRTLFQRVAQNPAPLLLLPPLPSGDIAPLLEAPAPVVVVRQRAGMVHVLDGDLNQALGRDSLRIYCTERIETALQSGTLVTAQGVPVIWAYRKTRAATPVVLVTVQLLLVSARSDPLDREDLLSALLAWAEAQVRTEAAEPRAEAEASRVRADPGLLRALAVAWAVRPDLDHDALLEWLWRRLGVRAGQVELDAALEVLQAEGILDAEGCLREERLSALVDEWNLRAWVREARREERG